jgi:hypothetical protein
MAQTPRQKQLLLTLLIVGLGAVLYLQWDKLTGGSSAPGEAAKLAVKQVASASLPAITPVVLDQSSKIQIRKNSRNLFNYSKSPGEVAEEVRQQREAERLAKEAAERRRIQQEAEQAAATARAQQLALNPPPPEAPPIPFRFIGKMGEPKAPIAVLADTVSGEVYTAREGEVIADKFKIQKIEFDSVTIGYTDLLIAKNPSWANEQKVIKMGS